MSPCHRHQWKCCSYKWVITLEIMHIPTVNTGVLRPPCKDGWIGNSVLVHNWLTEICQHRKLTLLIVWLLQSYVSNKAFSIVYIVVSLSENSYWGCLYFLTDRMYIWSFEGTLYCRWLLQCSDTAHGPMNKWRFCTNLKSTPWELDIFHCTFITPLNQANKS